MSQFDAGNKSLPFLTLAAIGVVYGDIGTSPLYALRECFHGPHAIARSEANVLGVLSLIFWALVLIISAKYLTVVLRADHGGEGGILSLMVIARRALPSENGWGRSVVLALGLFGAALLYGDGVITPAISVLSAVEGLSVATPFFTPYIAPIAIIILTLLFAFQVRGTGGIGAVFGPVTTVWFLCLAVLGGRWILREPAVLAAINPAYAVAFFRHNGTGGFLVLGAVVLVVTGGEALYADLGHFGRRPIRLAWFGLALPALLINYFGQGALLLSDPSAASNPFYKMAPQWALYPLVTLATLATVIASQAIITGAFSLTQQAVQLGYLPRFEIRHTSRKTRGQIYVPRVNWILLALTIWLVLNFKHSHTLAAAYGIAVTTTMVITTLLLFVVMRRLWKWNRWLSLALLLLFLGIDLAFFFANALKFLSGGWFPIAIAAIVFVSMRTWKQGRRLLHERIRKRIVGVDSFIESIRMEQPTRITGVAVTMTSDPTGVPVSLLHNFKFNHVLHETTVLFTVESVEQPTVPKKERLELKDLGEGIYRLVARYGYMERPNVPAALEQARGQGLACEPSRATYILGRETLIPSAAPGLAKWRKKLFGLMSRNQLQATSFYNIPAERVLEIGLQVEL